MNSRYPFLRDVPTVPPLSACISSLKKQASDSADSSSLFLLDSLLADMKSQLNDLKMKELNTWDVDDADLNAERADFIAQQVLDARHWLEVDLEQERSILAQQHQSPQQSAHTHVDLSDLPPHLQQTILNIEDEEQQHKMQWNNNLVSNVHLPLSQSIVAFETEAQKNGFERVKEPVQNPFEQSQMEQFMNRMQARYGAQNNSAEEEVIAESSSPEDTVDALPQPQFEPLSSNSKRSPSTSTRSNQKKKCRPTKHLNNFVSEPQSSTPRRPLHSTASRNKTTLQSHPSSAASSQRRTPKKKRPVSRGQEPVPPEVQIMRSIERPVSRQALRPQKHIMTNNFLEETKPAPLVYPEDDDSPDPFVEQEEPVWRSNFPKPTIDVRSTPQKAPAYYQLDDDVVPPSPIEKELLRKQRPPTRKKGPPNALDLERPIPIVQFDGNSPSGDISKATSAVQTDALEEHLRAAREFVREQNEVTNVTSVEGSALHSSQNFVDTPTDLLRRPLRGAPSFQDDDSVIVRLREERLEGLNQEDNDTAPATSTTLDRDLDAVQTETVSPPAASPHKAEVRIPTPKKITPKRRLSNAGLEFLSTELPSSVRRPSDSTIATSELVDHDPFVPMEASAPFTTKSGISNNDTTTSFRTTTEKRSSHSTSVPKTHRSSITPKNSRRDSLQQNSRLLTFLESPLHPKTEEQKKKRNKRKKSVAHGDRVARRPSTAASGAQRRPSSAAPTTAQPPRRKSKHRITKPEYPSLTEEPQLPDHIHQPLQHLDPNALRELINLSDRSNRGKKTKRLMHLLWDVDELYAKYHEK